MMTRRQTAATALSILAMLYTLGAYRQLPAIPSFGDFDAYYLSAGQLLKGMNPYLTTHMHDDVTVSDTPTWLLCFEPLAKVTRITAYWTWFWINVSAVVLSIGLLIRELDVSRADAVIVAALLVMYPPLAENFWYGQSEIFLGLVLVLMLVALRRNHDRLAGLSLAAATLLRAYPLGLLGYLLVLRRWRALGWLGIGLVVGGAVTIALAGWDTVATFAEQIGVSTGAGLIGLSTTISEPVGHLKHPANLNLGWFVKWLYDRTATRPVPPYISILAVLAEVFAVVVCLLATRRIQADDPDWRGYGLWIVTVSLISPVAYYVFLCCFLPMIAGMCAAWKRDELPKRVLYAISASYLFTTLFPSAGHPLTVLRRLEVLALEKNHAHIVHILSETEALSLAMAWLAAYWFVRAVPARAIPDST
ncbi:MAG TPA: glycosyltransferase family 87 protein [Steroidobacteraceae bacterium]|nr:glycosyltransferase family 87 protein [Steroidobacteraceae bacterium]